LITNRNKPKVTIVNGKDRTFNIGFTVTFNKDNNMAKNVAYFSPVSEILSIECPNP
jgi:hypothetical protein